MILHFPLFYKQIVKGSHLQWHRIKLTYKALIILGSVWKMKDQHRQKPESSSDWTCLNCNNLNYSFRKICNRCKACTREQNHQNYLQLQYYQIYYQQPYYSSPDLPTTTQDQYLNTNYGYVAPIEVNKSEERSPRTSVDSTPSSQKSGTSETAAKEKSGLQNQGSLMFLLEHAWEGLYNSGDEVECKPWDEVEHTREEEEQDEQGEGILTNFDFTFI